MSALRLFEFSCNRCRRSWCVPMRLDPSYCTFCLVELECGEAPAQAGLFTAAADWLQLQQQAWSEVRARVEPPTAPLTRERLDLLLEGGAKVEGELEEKTGRFYLRSILLLDGSSLLVATSEGRPCIYQHIESRNP